MNNIQTTPINKIAYFWQKNNAKILLVLILSVFSFYSIFLALNLNTGYIPDETYRFEVSKAFSETWGIPDDVPITLETGEDLHRNPYLGYWLFGRVLYIYQQINPSASIRQELVALRIVNGLFALGTAILTYFISKELIKNKWYQLLPVFMLTNTLMFVFLSGGVSYDNPTNFVCALGLLFFIRVLNHKDFAMNSLGWMISIGIGTLIKHSVLPLAVILFVIWIVYIIRNRKWILLPDLRNNIKFIVLAAIF